MKKGKTKQTRRKTFPLWNLYILSSLLEMNDQWKPNHCQVICGKDEEKRWRSGRFFQSFRFGCFTSKFIFPKNIAKIFRVKFIIPIFISFVVVLRLLSFVLCTQCVVWQSRGRVFNGEWKQRAQKQASNDYFQFELICLSNRFSIVPLWICMRLEYEENPNTSHWNVCREKSRKAGKK